MTLSAVVMAAGLGTRLRPLTERYAKPVLPIDGRPVLGALLRELAAAGIREVTIVTCHLAEQVERLVGDGASWGLQARFARQEQPDGGSTDAVLAAGAEPPYLVLAADTLFARGDVGRFAAAYAESGAAGAVAVRRRPGPSSHRHAVRIRAGRVELMHDPEPGNELSGAPLWAVAEPVARRIETRPGNPPWELQTAFQQAIDEGEVIAGVEIGPTRDLTAPGDVLLENFAYLRTL
jgi:CTP:molybdopterin cytidylyltransferase MocA